MRQTRSFNLNDSNEAHKAIIERLDSEPSVSSVVVQALYHWYFDPHEVDTTIQHDNSDVLEAIAELSRKLDNVRVNSSQVADKPPAEKQVEWETIDPNDNTPFLRGVRNVAKPGRRLEAKQ